ncbi:MAG TPA: alpha/beta hydrolase, partial [Myxococcota bacterium]|nr:alpha/beta hydrolase [Myxococcota bacterium]
MSCYADGLERGGVPLLLVHAVHAGASAYDVRPLYEHYRARRPVYALDLPGFGFSERGLRLYSPRLMTDAVRAAAARVRHRHGGVSPDAIALALACEFLARAASEDPAAFRSVGLVSPTGLGRRGSAAVEGGVAAGRPLVRGVLCARLWSRPLFAALTSRRGLRLALGRVYGWRAVDEGLLAYAYETAHQPGAEHAAWALASGFLKSRDAQRVYHSLELPVWLAHGVRGHPAAAREAARIRGRPGWTVASFATGALPHFEALDAVVRSYDAFLGGLEASVAYGGDPRDPAA